MEASPEACAVWPVIGVTQPEVQSLDHFLV
jgi:hypothetical protein